MSLKTNVLTMLVALAICAGFTGQLMAEDAGADTPTCYVCETKKALTTSWFEMGADLRARQVHRNNRGILDKDDPNHEDHYTRIRPRVFATLKPTDWLDLNARLVMEWFYFDLPHAADNSPDEDVVFDLLNVSLHGTIGDMPVRLTAGRQDIRLGTGWLVLDGTPLDGSRTLYFDAARLTATVPAWEDTTVDVIAIGNKGEADGNLKPFNHDNVMQNVSETDETGSIVYLSNKGLCEGMTIDGYFIYTHRENFNINNNVADIYTVGSRVAGRLGSSGLSYDVEGAVQYGQREDIVGRVYQTGQDICIDGEFGINSSLVYDIGGDLNAKAKLGYEYRSGDDNNGRGFDILWGRWPQFSEIFAGGPDRLENAQPAMYNNIHRINLGMSFDPIKNITVAADYNLLVTDNNNVNTAAIRGSGNIRGHHAKANVTWKHNHHLKSRVTCEAFVPGNYYSDNNNDIATFARYELTLTW